VITISTSAISLGVSETENPREACSIAIYGAVGFAASVVIREHQLCSYLRPIWLFRPVRNPGSLSMGVRLADLLSKRNPTLGDLGGLLRLGLRRGWVAINVLSIAQFLLGIDFTVLFFDSFGITDPSLPWLDLGGKDLFDFFKGLSCCLEHVSIFLNS
jgi:hypothetical protein